uniref:PIH1 domain containing 2 n=1 Tax=Echeneis naucrates TaxID=173247 RepID=A0A665TS17_ECHNA
MSSRCGTQEVLQQVNQIWSMLDDLSENDPEAYSSFIRKQMEGQAEVMSPPQLHSCLRTDTLEQNKGLLYINICSWKCVPAPKDPSKPLPIYPGELETCTSEDQEHKKDLIQVISTTLAQPMKPEYQLQVKIDAAGVPHSVELTVELPKVSSYTLPKTDDVLLEVEDIYFLLVEFPKPVKEDTASAVFNKKKRRLTLKVDVF